MRGCRGGACAVTGEGHARLPGRDMRGCWGGACMVAGVCVVAGGLVDGGGGVVVRGHAWLLGGMCGCWEGVCMVAGGHAWLPGEGAWMVAGGHGWLPGGMRGCRGACVGYDEMRSMSGRYASYWNAFLFTLNENEVGFNKYPAHHGQRQH